MRILIFGLLSLYLFSLTSCGNIREEVWIEPDNSGRITHTTDASDLRPLVRIALTEMTVNGEQPAKGEEFFYDLLAKEKFDSTFNFLHIIQKMNAIGEGEEEDLRLSVLNNEEFDAKKKEKVLTFMDKLEDIILRIEIDQEREVMKFHVQQEFTEVEQINSYIDEMMLLSPDDNPEDMATGESIKNMMGSNSSFRWEGKKLLVKINKIDKEAMGAEASQPLSMVSAFLNDPQYQMVINFPNKVKSVDHPNAVIEKKRKVILSVPLEKILKEDIEFSILTK